MGGGREESLQWCRNTPLNGCYGNTSYVTMYVQVVKTTLFIIINGKIGNEEIHMQIQQ